MYLRKITLSKTSNDRFRRQHRNCVIPQMAPFRVAFRRPEQQRVAPYQVRASLNAHEDAIRQRTQRGLVRDLFFPVDSRRVECQIHFVGERRPWPIIEAPPRISESVVALSPALSAGPVPG